MILPNCKDCGLLCPTSPQVPGRKYASGGLVIVGEAPGEEEVVKKEPFVGYTGKFLREVLRQYGVSDFHVTNVVMCRPPDNRVPTPSEIVACKDRLFSEILEQEPRKLLLLGSTPSETFLGEKITKVQGAYRQWNGIPTIATWHPSFVIRRPETFRDFVFDIGKLLRDPKSVPIGSDGYPEVPYTLIGTGKAALDLLCNLPKGTKVVVDIETSNFEVTSKFLAFGIATSPTDLYIIPGDIFRFLDVPVIFETWERNQIHVIVHNWQYEYSWFAYRFKASPVIGTDTMLLHYNIDERSGDDNTTGQGRSYHGLKTLGGKYYDIPDWSHLMDPYKEDYSLAPEELLYRYLALDLRVTFQLYEDMTSDPEANTKVLYDIMQPAIPFLVDMEMGGVHIDRHYFKNLEIQWGSDLEQDLKGIQEKAGKPGLNLRSPQQVAAWLFDEMGLPQLDGRSTNSKEVLAKLIKKFPHIGVLKDVRDYRSKAQILSTFIKGIPKKCTEESKVHTSFLLHGSDTGRLASRHPNLQNIPSRIGGVIRDGFVVPEGWTWVENDYKQLEFRVAAYYCNDPVMIEFINSGRNVHQEVGCMFFHCESKDLTKSMQLDAKAVVFGTLYRRSAESIAEEFDITVNEAQRRVDIVFGLFPSLKSWMDEQGKKALELGYVESVFGRKRRFPLVTRQNKVDILAQAINSPIQSTASDICLTAGTRIFEQIKHRTDEIRPLLTVHDSLSFAIKDDKLDYWIPRIRDIMEIDPFPTPVKFIVETSIGQRWGSLEKLEVPK